MRCGGGGRKLGSFFFFRGREGEASLMGGGKLGSCFFLEGGGGGEEASLYYTTWGEGAGKFGGGGGGGGELPWCTVLCNVVRIQHSTLGGGERRWEVWERNFLSPLNRTLLIHKILLCQSVIVHRWWSSPTHSPLSPSLLCLGI